MSSRSCTSIYFPSLKQLQKELSDEKVSKCVVYRHITTSPYVVNSFEIGTDLDEDDRDDDDTGGASKTKKQEKVKEQREEEKEEEESCKTLAEIAFDILAAVQRMMCFGESINAVDFIVSNLMCSQNACFCLAQSTDSDTYSNNHNIVDIGQVYRNKFPAAGALFSWIVNTRLVMHVVYNGILSNDSTFTSMTTTTTTTGDDEQIDQQQRQQQDCQERMQEKRKGEELPLHFRYTVRIGLAGGNRNVLLTFKDSNDYILEEVQNRFVHRNVSNFSKIKKHDYGYLYTDTFGFIPVLLTVQTSYEDGIKDKGNKKAKRSKGWCLFPSLKKDEEEMEEQSREKVHSICAYEIPLLQTSRSLILKTGNELECLSAYVRFKDTCLCTSSLSLSSSILHPYFYFTATHGMSSGTFAMLTKRGSFKDSINV
jgi:hypothetical protein